MLEHIPTTVPGRGFEALSTGLFTDLSTVSVDNHEGQQRAPAHLAMHKVDLAHE